MAKKQQKEADFYPVIEKWLKKSFKCFSTGIKKGTKYSEIDVVGVRDIGGERSGVFEIISVEVKRKGQPFATSCGQAYGYRIYANMLYLAEKREMPFSEEEIRIAGIIGIGLLEISEGNRVKQVLSSPHYMPELSLSLHILENLRLGKCQFCGTLFFIGNNTSKFSNTSKVWNKAYDNEKGLVFWNWEQGERNAKLGLTRSTRDFTYERRVICPCCVHLLGDLVHNWDYGEDE